MRSIDFNLADLFLSHISHQLRLSGLRVHVHGAYLVHLEALAVLADALLREQDRAGRGLLDLRTDDGHDDQGRETPDDAAQDVQRPLQEHLSRRRAVHRAGQHVDASHSSASTIW